MTVLKICRLPHSQGLPLPAYETAGAAGMDLHAAVDANAPITLQAKERKLVPTGICIELPEQHEGQIRPRSGLAIKNGISLINTPGTIDEDYRGELKIPLINHSDQAFEITRGMRIAQLVIAPIARPQLMEVKSLSDSERGEAGFGSTGTGQKGK